MDSTPLVRELKPATLRLEQLFLDPNNPRFVGPTWEYITTELIDDETTQQEARKRLVASHDVDRLRESIELNGYLPIDPVVVREFKPDRYVVLEGNRRICAAKLVGEFTIAGDAVPKAVIESLKLIPCQVYLGSEEDAAWVFQGLRHVSGIRDWPAYNKARLLVEQMEENSLSLTQVGRRFGISSYNAGQWRRAYKAFEQAREAAEKADKVGEEAFPYFQELFNRSCVALRDWLRLDDKESKFDPTRLSEIEDWLYPDPTEEDAEPVERAAGTDLFKRRRLKQAIDLRDLTEVLEKSMESFENFRRRPDVALYALYAEVTYREHVEAQEKQQDLAKDTLEALERSTRLLENVPLKVVNDADFAKKFRTESAKLTEAIKFVTKNLTAK